MGKFASGWHPVEATPSQCEVGKLSELQLGCNFVNQMSNRSYFVKKKIEKKFRSCLANKLTIVEMMIDNSHNGKNEGQI